MVKRHQSKSHSNSCIKKQFKNHGTEPDTQENQDHKTFTPPDDDVCYLSFYRKCQIDVHKRDHRSRTALHYASMNGHLKFAKFLLNKNANLNAKDARDRKPIHFAAEWGHKDLVEYFIEKGADINEYNRNNWATLHYACAGGYEEVVKFLLDKGADVSSQNCKKHFSPLNIAALYPYIGVVKQLVDFGLKPNDCDLSGETALHAATRENNLEVIEYLYKRGANLNVSDKNGVKLIQIAIHKGQADVVRFLLSNSIDICDRDNKGRTWLHRAASNADIVEMLISAGISVNVQDCSGQTALHYAVKYGKFNSVKNMIHGKIDLDIQDNTGNTALHLASQFHFVRIILCLLEAGARSDIKNVFGRTMLACYITYSHRKYTSEKYHYYEEKIISHIKEFVNIDDIGRKTAAHFAMECRPYSWFSEFILLAQKDLSMQDIYGNTLMNCFVKSHNISYKDYIKLVRLLVNGGAYFDTDDYQQFIRMPFLQEKLFRDIEFCTQSVANGFYGKKLRLICSQMADLPPIENLKFSRNQMEDLTKAVEEEIKINGFCNVLEVKPVSLIMLCADAYISHYLSV